jgi:excisionase family DNA binding protein
MSSERLLTAREVGEQLAVSERYVWRLARDGGLPRVEIGKYVRFREDDVAAFIEVRTTRTTRPGAVLLDLRTTTKANRRPRRRFGTGGGVR